MSLSNTDVIALMGRLCIPLYLGEINKQGCFELKNNVYLFKCNRIHVFCFISVLVFWYVNTDSCLRLIITLRSSRLHERIRISMIMSWYYPLKDE